MRLRTQLLISTAVAGVVGLLAVAALVLATRLARHDQDEQARSQEVVRHVANMLALTNEFAVFGGERAATQWRARSEQLLAAIDDALRHESTPEPTLLELQHDVADLTPIFEKLVEIGRSPESDLGQRRRELLFERLLAETQGVVESRHRWALVIAQTQQHNQQHWTVLVAAAPATLILVLLGMAGLVARRVLGPVRRLEAAAIAIQNGDLDARCASAARNELGDAARAVDAMALALQRQSAAVRQSEQRLRTIADNLPALICHVDNQERYTFVNAGFAPVAQGDPQSLLGRSLREVHDPAFYEVLRAPTARALGGEEVRFEYARLADDRPMYRQSIHIPDLHADGSVQGFYAMSFDITERKQAELRLAASERLLVSITDSLPALVCYVDDAHRYRFANSRYLEWRGVDAGAMLGRRADEVVGAAFHRTAGEHAAAALGGERRRWEYTALLHGQERQYRVDFIPDTGPDGATRGFCGLTIDITDMKQAQQLQARSERQLRAIADNLPVLIGYIGPDERYRFINATAARVLGMNPEQVVGRTMAEAMDPDNYAARRDHLRTALGGERVAFDIDSENAGQTRHLQTIYIPDIQPDGRIDGAYLLGMDVTELKRSEQQLRQLARFDSLTKLPNRRQFEERLAEAVARSTRDRRPIALMFLDIDHFKRINDSWGHAVGDAVLAEFARRLRHSVRATDMPARLAGDEFVVLLEGLHGEADAGLVAEKLIAAIRQPFRVAGAELRVTTSVGVAYAARPAPNSDLMDFADQALYRAKGAGRDTFEMSSMGTYQSQLGTLDESAPASLVRLAGR